MSAVRFDGPAILARIRHEPCCPPVFLPRSERRNLTSQQCEPASGRLSHSPVGSIRRGARGSVCHRRPAAPGFTRPMITKTMPTVTTEIHRADEPIPATSMLAPRSISGTAIQRSKGFITAPPIAPSSTSPRSIVAFPWDAAQGHSSRIQGRTAMSSRLAVLIRQAARCELYPCRPRTVVAAGRQTKLGVSGRSEPS